MDRPEEVHRRNIAKHTIATAHPSGLQSHVSVQLANVDSCTHESESTKKKKWEGACSSFLPRHLLGSAHATPVLGRRSDVINEGRLSQQCTPVMRRRERETGSPVRSALPGRCVRVGEEDGSDLNNAIISGWLKFWDNKKWKSRWGVVTKLSPAADCLHLQLYRDPKDRYKKSQTKASLLLQHFLGFESSFTLDKESNTIAIICQDVVVILAFETRERLIAWQIKVGSHLGSSREFVVLVEGRGMQKLPAGPARLHLQGRTFALTSGLPPRLLGVWDLAHLRRYGVVEKRFCFEGGSLCGKMEGLYVLITDQMQNISEAFDLAAKGNLKTPRGIPTRKISGGDMRPCTRLSDWNTAEQSLPDTASGFYEKNFIGEDCSHFSPYWPSNEERSFDETYFIGSDIEAGAKLPWTKADHISLKRCSNFPTQHGVPCSSTIAHTPHFNPAWTMSSSNSSLNNMEYSTPKMTRKSLKAYQCKEEPHQRPTKLEYLENKKPLAPFHKQCACVDDNAFINNLKGGPYVNYDVPKYAQSAEVSEYYDIPKGMEQRGTENLLQITEVINPDPLILEKNCTCILKFVTKTKPVIVKCKENLQLVECPCVKVTSWANNLISLPYRTKNPSNRLNKETMKSPKSQELANYALVDVSKKIKRENEDVSKKGYCEDSGEHTFTIYQNIEPPDKIHMRPCANYENLEFVMSLKYNEKAKDLMKQTRVSQNKPAAFCANVNLASSHLQKTTKLSTTCEPCQNKNRSQKIKGSEYLLIEHPKNKKRDVCKTVFINPGYTPMSPNLNWSLSLKYSAQKTYKLKIKKSLSIPTLNGDNTIQSSNKSFLSIGKKVIQKRCRSVESALFSIDLKEFDKSIGCHATSYSLETSRNSAIENKKTSSRCGNNKDLYDCCKFFAYQNNTSEAISSTDVPNLGQKLMNNAEVKRSSEGNRDSSSSNDSGVSSCSVKHGGELYELEMPLISEHFRYQNMIHKPMKRNLSSYLQSSKSSYLLRDEPTQICKGAMPTKSSSAEAEVPVLPQKQYKGVMDTHSTSSGTSDISDYIETLSMTSSYSSFDTPSDMRISRQPTNTLRPRAGKEYYNLDPIITSMYKSGKES